MGDINITGKVNGDRKVAAMFNFAPEAMTGTIRRWFYSIKRKYVGNKTRTGSYPRWLERQRLKGRDGTWSRQAAGAFKGFVKAGTRLEAMQLRMGAKGAVSTYGGDGDSVSGFMRGVHMMSQGGGVVTSTKFMPVPIYQNLRNIGVTNKTHKAFTDMNQRDELVTLRSGNKMLFVHMPTVEEGGNLHDSTMFVGAKSVRIPGVDFQFESRFSRVFPRELAFGQKRIDRTIRGLEKGYIKPR